MYHEPAATAVCKKCEQEKTGEQFSKDGRYKTGLSPWCKECYREYQQGRKPRSNEAARANYRKLRMECLAAYSGNSPKCACCGEGHIEFLAIDHIDGTGSEERERLGLKGGRGWYRHLKKSGFPPGYRVLCHNCNCALGFYGYCPHEREHQAA